MTPRSQITEPSPPASGAGLRPRAPDHEAELAATRPAWGRNRLLILVAAGAVLIVALVLAYRLGSGAAPDDQPPVPTPIPTPSPSVPSVSDVFSVVGPSVVVVRTPEGLGTGVIVAEDATILTAHHVIERTAKITVTYSDGTSTTAAVTSSDRARDIATLAPESLPDLLVPAVLGGGTEVGASVVAIGNPLGLTYSVSSGVVSGLDRTATTDHGKLSGLIQFDAAVNPGSSGGPLLDQGGNVIGVVVSIADPGGDDSWAGVSFAVPIGAALGGGGDGDGPAGGPRL